MCERALREAKKKIRGNITSSARPFKMFDAVEREKEAAMLINKFIEIKITEFVIAAIRSTLLILGIHGFGIIVLIGR